MRLYADRMETIQCGGVENSPNDHIHHQTVARQSHHKHHRVDGDDDGDNGRHRLGLRVPAAVQRVVEGVRQGELPVEVREALLRLSRGTLVLFVDAHHAVLHGDWCQPRWIRGNDLTAWEKEKTSEVFPQVDEGGGKEKNPQARNSLRSRTPEAKRWRLTCLSVKPKVHSNSKTRFSVDDRAQRGAKNVAKQTTPGSCGLLQGNKHIHAVSLEVRAGKPPRSVCDIRGRRASRALPVRSQRSAQASCGFWQSFATTGAHACARTMRLKGFLFPKQLWMLKPGEVTHLEPGDDLSCTAIWKIIWWFNSRYHDEFQVFIIPLTLCSAHRSLYQQQPPCTRIIFIPPDSNLHLTKPSPSPYAPKPVA